MEQYPAQPPKFGIGGSIPTDFDSPAKFGVVPSLSADFDNTEQPPALSQRLRKATGYPVGDTPLKKY